MTSFYFCFLLLVCTVDALKGASQMPTKDLMNWNHHTWFWSPYLKPTEGGGWASLTKRAVSDRQRASGPNCPGVQAGWERFTVKELRSNISVTQHRQRNDHQPPSVSSSLSQCESTNSRAISKSVGITAIGKLDKEFQKQFLTVICGEISSFFVITKLPFDLE